MSYWFWAKSAGWLNKSSCQAKANGFDALGGALKVLSSLWQRLSVENIEVLLAIGSLSEESEWIELKKMKTKLPHLSANQLNRNINTLSDRPSIISLFSKSPALIQIRQSPTSNREKEVSLTRIGTLLLHRSLQALGVDQRNKLSRTAQGASQESLLQLTVSGATRSGERVQIETSRLITTGVNGYGKIEATLPLCGQAIAQGASVYWIGTKGDLKVPAWLYSVSELQLRSHAFFIIGEVPENYVQISAPEIMARQGICYHNIGTGNVLKTGADESSEKVLAILGELAAAVELHPNIAGCFIVIDGFSLISKLRDDSTRQILDRLFKAGVKLHVIEHGQSEDPGMYRQLQEGGFDLAVFGEDSKEANVGEATFKPHDGAETFFQFDFVDIHLSREICPSNLRQ